ncbi:uncharacterized protein lsp1a isoform X2 [Genypterus blacodes]|uniref:uncharacterized protein lsp1a isoform X2 n=1 Tax=Genypterus blacodes TaxID=154954 RepID=UPI003F767D97
MSSTLVRRNSSKVGLQKLMRLTTQRSIEDAEEVEREQRRRAREASCRKNSNSGAESSPENEAPTEDMYDDDLKPSSSLSLEEDEGFSDWTQRRERRRQQRLQELSRGGEQDEDEEEDASTSSRAVPEKSIRACISSSSSSSCLQRQEEEAEKRKEKEEGQGKMATRRDEIQRPETEAEKRKEMKVSCTSRVFLHQEPKLSNINGEAAQEEVTSSIHSRMRKVSRAADAEKAEDILETEQRLEKIRRSHQEKESQELEQMRHRQVEAEQELEELKRRREDRRRVRVEEERLREEEELQRLAKEEEERRRMKEDIERRRIEAAERLKSLSSSSVDGEETFSPLSPKAPTHKITERTESLNRSLKKSNSFKKTLPPVLLSKIDDKLEQYAHAVENSQESRAMKLTDLPSSPEAVASKKNLFEAGEVWCQSPSKGTSGKDTEGLKVGVAGLITQWVKGSSDGSSRQSLGKAADVKLGDVMQKRNMWEVIGDSSGRAGPRDKGSASGKKYKFIVTGHGKYTKIPLDNESRGEFTNGKSDFCHSED